MKKVLYILILLSAFLYSRSIEDGLYNIVTKWNMANNNRDTITLSKLYNKNLTYYGKKLSKYKVIKDKKRFFRKYIYFKQTISNIEYERLTPRLYKISFDKFVKLKRNSREKNYPSYLLINTSSSKFLIEEEGDVITDRNIASRGVKKFYFDKIATISGEVYISNFYGPPNYGDTPNIDKKLKAYILKLPSKIKVINRKRDDELDETTITNEVQLVLNNFKLIDLAIKNALKVKIKGEFFSAHTGYHIRKLLIDVKSISIY